jgi:hypothetical protein
VILFDPIFQGLAVALIGGEVAATLLSRVTVPVLYYLTRRAEEARSHTPSPGRGPERVETSPAPELVGAS